VAFAIELLNELTDQRPHLPFPHSSQVEGELRELRCHHGRDRYRILYRRSEQFIVLLHIFRKNTAQIPESEKAIARVRWDDFGARMSATPRTPPRPLGKDAPMASPNQSIYAGTKGAVDAITLSLSKELGARKIRVNGLNPGAVETEGLSGSGFLNENMKARILASTPLGRIGQPKDIANVTVFLASDESYWINGQIIFAAGGLTY